MSNILNNQNAAGINVVDMDGKILNQYFIKDELADRSKTVILAIGEDDILNLISYINNRCFAR